MKQTKELNKIKNRTGLTLLVCILHSLLEVWHVSFIIKDEHSLSYENASSTQFNTLIVVTSCPRCKLHVDGGFRMSTDCCVKFSSIT